MSWSSGLVLPVSMCVKKDNIPAPTHRGTINILMIIMPPENKVMKVVSVCSTTRNVCVHWVPLTSSLWRAELLGQGSWGRTCSDPRPVPTTSFGAFVSKGWAGAPPGAQLGLCLAGWWQLLLVYCFNYVSHALWFLRLSLTAKFHYHLLPHQSPRHSKCNFPKGPKGHQPQSAKVFGDDPAVSPAQLQQMSTSRKAEPALQPQETIP